MAAGKHKLSLGTTYGRKLTKCLLKAASGDPDLHWDVGEGRTSRSPIACLSSLITPDHPAVDSHLSISN